MHTGKTSLTDNEIMFGLFSFAIINNLIELLLQP